MYHTPPPVNYPVYLQYSSCKHAFSIRMEKSVDPDQMASSEPALLSKGINLGSGGHDST